MAAPSLPLLILWDGNNIVAVKAASTAPTASDPAAVVALSPNSLAADNSVNGTKLPVLAARANAAAPTNTEGRQVPLSVDLLGNLRVAVSSLAPAVATTSATTGVAAATTSTTLLAANANRRGATIHNDSSSGVLYVRLGTPAASTSGNYSTVLQPGSLFEVPFNYTGAITGIWTNAAAGFANVTELTP